MESVPPATQFIPKKPDMTLKFSEDTNTGIHEYQLPKTPYPHRVYLPIHEEEHESDLENKPNHEEANEEQHSSLDHDDDIFSSDN
ncbi:hypothetical protein K7432_010194 [Basidiobolus ranarum]|uniref:Uncharacterized protein n=1 Tax=Basidiobolus ranarum TaxID=34480 RepID=A0ABR2VVU8_9FUNG